MFYSSQQDIRAELENVDLKTKKNIIMEKNKTKICIPAKGTYKITPRSCQKFKDPFYIYNTDKPVKLFMVPVEFLVRGLIKIDNQILQKVSNISDLKFNVLIDEISNNNRTMYKKLNLEVKDKDNEFRFYAKPNSNLIITPHISEALTNKEIYKNLLFIPREKKLSIEQNCFEDLEYLTFEVKSGLIIEGKINPVMSNVQVSSINKNTGDLIATTFSDEKGNYKIGPLLNEDDYQLIAVKEGFKIKRSSDNDFNFNAEKLSFLKVKIVDTNLKPLSSVFISLSSAEHGFKINNSTNNEGFFNFVDLFSGEYYIKPLYKEYIFDPPQKLVKIQGGQHYEEVLTAKRIAFSIYGKGNFKFIII